MDRPLSTIGDLILRPELRFGLTAGTVALVLGITFRAVARRETRTSIGVLLGTGCVIALFLSETAGRGLLLGGVLTAVGGQLVASRDKRILAWLLLGSGSLVIAASAHPSDDLPVALVSAAAISVAGMRIAVTELRTAGRTLPLLAISAGGLVVGVPDVEPALVLAGTLLPIGLVALRWPVWLLGSSGAFLMSGVYIFAVVVGSAGRLGSMIGGVAALGLLVGPRLSWQQWHQQGAIHLLWVVYATRVIGLRTSLVQSLVLLAVGLAVWALIWKLWYSPAPDTSDPAV
jgi:hypothetical protein